MSSVRCCQINMPDSVLVVLVVLLVIWDSCKNTNSVLMGFESLDIIVYLIIYSTRNWTWI